MTKITPINASRIGRPNPVGPPTLGGISRITFQMGVSTLPHAKMMHAIELLGTRVAPIVREELAVTTR